MTKREYINAIMEQENCSEKEARKLFAIYGTKIFKPSKLVGFHTPTEN